MITKIKELFIYWALRFTRFHGELGFLPVKFSKQQMYMIVKEDKNNPFKLTIVLKRYKLGQKENASYCCTMENVDKRDMKKAYRHLAKHILKIQAESPSPS